MRNNEREREELEECLKEMSLTDEEREEVHSSLMNLMEHGSRLDKENESLRARLKEYEDNPVPRELELLRKEGERVRLTPFYAKSFPYRLIGCAGSFTF